MLKDNILHKIHSHPVVRNATITVQAKTFTMFLKKTRGL